mmetsp:Transcript_49246/g.140925  ORF Transcript_49246/g.140925 Transcript_49246/m.140925 type:complete len:289 (+) Transcript_49246:295-1161(+)
MAPSILPMRARRSWSCGSQLAGSAPAARAPEAWCDESGPELSTPGASTCESFSKSGRWSSLPPSERRSGAEPPRSRSMRSKWVSISLRTNLRRFITSLTVAPLLPRSSSTLSIRLPKESVLRRGSSSFASKKRSVRSTSPTTSMPTSWSSRAARGFPRICWYSSFVIARSQACCAAFSGKLVISTSRSLSLTKATSRASFSVDATASTTSQRMPISMFIIVRAAIITKSMKTHARPALSSRRVSISGRSSSKRAPCISRVYIDMKTPSKGSRMGGWSTATCAKNMAKT